MKLYELLNICFCDVTVAYGKKKGCGAIGGIYAPFVTITDYNKDVLKESLKNKEVNYIQPYGTGIIAYIKV